MKDFLRQFAETGQITAAAKRAGITKKSHYDWLAKNEKYKAAFQRAKRDAGDALESEAVRRATQGWEEPIYYQGTKVGDVTRYDSGMLQFLLRGMMPEKYGNKTEVSGPAGAPIQAKIEIVFVEPDASE